MDRGKKRKSLAGLHGIRVDGGQGGGRESDRRERETSKGKAITGEPKRNTRKIEEPLLVYDFGSRSRCPACGSLQTRVRCYNAIRADSPARQIQYRECLICGIHYKNAGRLI